MKNRFRLTILLLTIVLVLSQGTMTAYAETEGSSEGGMVVTQSGNASADATLSSLKIAQATLSPEFSPNQLTYTAKVPYEVERVALTAQTNCPDARKVIRGTSDLEVGENVVTVTVTAENGSVREYRITLIREEMPEGDPNETTEDLTEETTPQETSQEDTTSEDATPEDATPEETMPPETIIIPPDTEANGGISVETTEEDSWDLNSMLLNPMFLIFLVVSILLVSLFAIVTAVIVLREKRRGVDEDDDEDDEESEENEEDNIENEDDFEEIIYEDPQNDPSDSLQEVPGDDPVESQENDGDDLDDDFEMLLEDDDDFDFLDF